MWLLKRCSSDKSDEYSLTIGISLLLKTISKLTQKLFSKTSCVFLMLSFVIRPGVIINTFLRATPNGAIDIKPLLPVPVGKTTRASLFSSSLKNSFILYMPQFEEI